MTIHDGLYGNLADTALGEERFKQDARDCVKRAGLSPMACFFWAVALAVISLSALAALGDVPDRIAEATPAIADLENWLVWGDVRRF